MMLSYDSLETGTGSSNSLSSANESPISENLRRNARHARVYRRVYLAAREQSRTRIRFC